MALDHNDLLAAMQSTALQAGGRDLKETTGGPRTSAQPALLASDESSSLDDGRPRARSRKPPPESIGRYRILSLLGEGAFGAVFLAHDDLLQRKVAIKASRPGRLKTLAETESFLREARLAAQLRHPALIEVFDVGRDEDLGCYIVMEYVAGRTLSEVAQAAPLACWRSAAWIATVADAVHCAHKIGLIHCDLKPANILLDRNEQPHVADFGLAISELDQRTREGLVGGSPAYMAPEQIRGEAHRFDGRTDLWALGAILYELLTGRKPFSGSGFSEIFDEILHREPKPPRQIDDTIPIELEWICLKCLSKEVRERYTTGFDLAVDLRQAISNVGGDDALRGPISQSATEGDKGRSPAARKHLSPLERSSRSNLPPEPLNDLIGREREVAHVMALLAEPNTRLLTLLGPGGMGKSRLALQVAHQLSGERPGGCWFAELSECRTATDVAYAVARALQAPLSDAEPPELAVAHVLQFRKPLLLVLDNFEQVVSAAQSTIGQWGQLAPDIQFLVTSRIALGLNGERTFELEPLALPSPDASLASSDLEQIPSIRLFCERARAANERFQGNELDLPAIAAICAQLDGIPLALELAAARIKVLTPSEIVQRLERKFELLQSSRRDVATRQQTLSGAIDWSFDLLCDWERHAFMQICAFRGGFDWDAAEAVIDLSPFSHAPTTLDVVQSLRDKSLLIRQETSFGTRFGIYQSIREYGDLRSEREIGTAERASLHRRLASHFIARTESWNGKIDTANGIEALARLEPEIENIFAVQDHSLKTGDAQTAARAILAIDRAIAIRGPAGQRLPRLERSLAALGADSSPLAATLLVAASEAAQASGDWDRAEQLADRAVNATRSLQQPALGSAALRQQAEIHRQRGAPDVALVLLASAEELSRSVSDPRGVAACLVARGFVLWQQGNSDLALELITESERICHSLGAKLDAIPIARRKGHVMTQQGNTFQALRCYAEAEAIAREFGDDRSLRLAVGDRANVLAIQGDFSGALDCYHEAEALARRLGDKRGLAVTIGNRGILLADQGQPAAALQCYVQAEALNREMQSRYGIAVNLGNRGVALDDLGRYDEALACLSAARAMNEQTGNKFLLALNRGDLAAVFQHQGYHAKAQVELSAALELLEAVHSRSVEAFVYDALLSAVERCLGNRAQSEWWAGKALELAAELHLTDSHPKLKARNYLAALRASHSAQ